MTGRSAQVVYLGVVASLVFARPCRTLYLAAFVPRLAAGCLLLLALVTMAMLVIQSHRDYLTARRGSAVLLASVAGMTAVCSFAFARATATGASVQAVASFLPYLELPLFLLMGRGISLDFETTARAFALGSMLVATSVLLDAEGLWNLGTWGGLVVRPGLSRVLYRPAGWLVSRNYAGEYLAISTPLALLSSTPRVLLATAMLTSGMALGLTRCRTGGLALLVGLSVVLVFSRKDRRRFHGLMSGLVLFGMVCASLVPTRLSWREPNPFATTLTSLLDLQHGSGALRLEQYRVTWSLLRGHLLDGLGMGSWQELMRKRAFDLGMNAFPSSDYLRLLCDGGIFALLLGCLSIGALISTAFRAQRSVMLAPLAAWATVSLADAALFRPEITFLLAALAIATVRAPPE